MWFVKMKVLVTHVTDCQQMSVRNIKEKPILSKSKLYRSRVRPTTT